jgi:ABC-2 type transport system ATP-binding protein
MITVDHLSVSYGNLKAVQDFSFSVKSGEIYSLVGPDGAGKTTIIRSICRLLNPDSGSVTFDGIDAFRDYEKVKPLIGYMPQSFSLYPDLSVEENLKFYSGIYGYSGPSFREKREYLYSFSNLKPFAMRRAGALSGGMKQKLALSCALIHDPKVLILDEPTTGVDPVSRRQFWEILEDLREHGAAIIVSTPYMDEVLRCNRAAFIFDGHKLAEGTPLELSALFEGKVYYLNVEPKQNIVEAINSISGLSAQRFGAGLHIYLNPGDSIENYRSSLDRAGIELKDLDEVSVVLEDAFIRLLQDRV